jgi:hypothetical protein
MKNIMMAVMVSVVGAQVCASDEYRFVYKITNDNGHQFYVIDDNDYIVDSAENAENLVSLVEKYKPHYTQLMPVIRQQDKLIDGLRCLEREAHSRAEVAQKLAEKTQVANIGMLKLAKKQQIQLTLQRWTINTLTLVNAGLIGYYWYQWYFGTQQNCPLQ